MYYRYQWGKILKKNAKECLAGCPFSGAVLEQLGFLLGKAVQKLHEFQGETLGPLGLTGKHLGILLVLKEKGSISQHEIGQCVHIDRTTMVAMIDDLEKLGLVERQGHPTDRRSHMVYLTAKGKVVLPKAHGLARTSQKKLLSSLTAKEQKALIDLLRKLVLTHFATNKGNGNI